MESMEYIRVLLMTAGYGGIFHERLTVSCDVDYALVCGGPEAPLRESHPAGEELSFAPDSPYFLSDRLWIEPEGLTGRVILRGVARAQGESPAYRGSLELLRTEEGILAINEVPLEEYLYSVVPSEMPAGYPAEALKAQAVCARTYACGRILQAGYPQYGAHVDDSTAYQVYNNLPEQESATAAVRETRGQVLRAPGGGMAETFYYSTSCGVGSDAGVWKTEAASGIDYLSSKPLNRSAMAAEAAAVSAGGASGVPLQSLGERLREEEAFADFIMSRNPEDFEAQEQWYRWRYEVEALDGERLRERLRRRWEADGRLVLTWRDGAYVSEAIGELGDVTDIRVEKRGSGGVADELVIEAGGRRIKVISEYAIRAVLCDGLTKAVRQDGSSAAAPNLLPSGFFVISTSKKEGNVVGYTLNGGGYGHGAGMSQNGARAMAESGYSAGEILLYFYEGCTVTDIYE